MGLLTSAEAKSQINVKIQSFEGPFDLLLHLIKKNEMDIYDVKIYDITSQYIEYLDKMKEIDLELASEFIVIAATLLEIKSRELLPKIVDETAEELSEDDVRKQLLDKLVEYKKIKAMAAFLEYRQKNSGEIYSKKPEIIIEEKKSNDDILKDITILDLYNLAMELVEKYNSKQNANKIEKTIKVDSYKVEDKMEELKVKLRNKKNIYFSKIISECDSKMEVIVTFLALLELIKQKNIKVLQGVNFSDIYIEEMLVDDYK